MSGLDVSQGKFRVQRQMDGRIRIECPPVMVLDAAFVVKVATSMLKQAGIEIVLAEPGQTVIRPPNAVARG